MLTLCAGAIWANEEVWAPAVPGGYPFAHKYDAGATGSNKVDSDGDGKLNSEADGNMCWAAATSDLIEYWQARYSQLTGQPLPEGVPSGTDGLRASKVFDAMVASWENKSGSVEAGLYWYFSGCVHASAIQSGAVKADTGGYWKDYCARLGYGNTYDAVRTDENPYFVGAFSSTPTVDSKDGWKDFVYGGFGKFVREALNGGSLVALSLKDPNGGPGGHSITLYGAEYADDGSLVGIYVHDNTYKDSELTYLMMDTPGRSITLINEDKDKGTSEEVTLPYNVLTVNLTEEKGGKLLTNGWVVNAVGKLALPIIPEPSTAILSLLALTGLALRRRRAA